MFLGDVASLTVQIWGALGKKVPNVLRRMGVHGRAHPSVGMTLTF